MSGFTKKELQDKCRSMGLPVSGTKSELLERIAAHESAIGVSGTTVLDGQVSIGDFIDSPEPIDFGCLKDADDLSAAIKFAGDGIIERSIAENPMSLKDGELYEHIVEIVDNGNGGFAVVERDRYVVGTPDPATGTLRVNDVYAQPKSEYVPFRVLMSSKYASLIAQRYGAMLPDVSFASSNTIETGANGKMIAVITALGAMKFADSEGNEHRIPHGTPAKFTVAFDPKVGTAALVCEFDGHTVSVGGTTQQFKDDMLLLDAVRNSNLQFEHETGRLYI